MARGWLRTAWRLLYSDADDPIPVRAAHWLIGSAALFVLAGWWMGSWPLIAAAVLHIGVGLYASVCFLPSRERKPRVPEHRVARLRGELALLFMTVAWAPLAAIVVVSLVANNFESELRVVSGWPAEVDSVSRQVTMFGEPPHTYDCRPGLLDSCHGRRVWAGLERFPEPKQVRMQVDGHSIQSLVMDGKVIVRLYEGAPRRRMVGAALSLILTGLYLWIALALVRRMRDLGRLKRLGSEETSA